MKKLLAVIIFAAMMISLISSTGIYARSALDGVGDIIRGGVLPDAIESGKIKEFSQENIDRVFDKSALMKSAGLNGANGLPSSYSSVEEGFITTPKNQGLDGACWLFAGTSAAEASYAVNTGELVDFSEMQTAQLFPGKKQDVLGYSSGDNNVCSINPVDGGNSVYSVFSAASWNGLELEENCPYSLYAAQVYKNYGKKDVSALYGHDVAHLQDARFVPYMYDEPAMMDLYKLYVIASGAIDCGYYHDDSGMNMNTCSYYSDRFTGMSNHEINIVGWNDSYPRTNFNEKCRPAADGAWLVKNNWGEYWGTDGDTEPGTACGGGYFWMSYYDTSISTVLVCNYVPADTYKYNYQYDGCSSLEYMTIPAGNSVCATYTVRGLTSTEEKLDAVGIGLYSVLTTGNISVYTGGTDGKPKSGKLVAQEDFVTDMWGYYTVELSNPPTLKAGESFTVVVTFDDVTDIFIDCECETAWGSCEPDFTNEKTYRMTPSGGVSSLSSMGVTPRLKAYTNDAGSAAEKNHTVTYVTGDGAGAPPAQIKAAGQDLRITFVEPYRDYYAFEGWSLTEGSKTVDYKPGDYYKTDSDLTLYAVWRATSPSDISATPEKFTLTVGRKGQTITVKLTPEELVPNLAVLGAEEKTEDGKTVYYKDGLRIVMEDANHVYVEAAEYRKPTVGFYLYDRKYGYNYWITADITGIIGDINHDGKVNTVDASMMKMLILGELEPLSDYMDEADINGDGKINAVDSSLLKMLILGEKI